MINPRQYRQPQIGMSTVDPTPYPCVPTTNVDYAPFPSICLCFRALSKFTATAAAAAAAQQ